MHSISVPATIFLKWTGIFPLKSTVHRGLDVFLWIFGTSTKTPWYPGAPGKPLCLWLSCIQKSQNLQEGSLLKKLFRCVYMHWKCKKTGCRLWKPPGTGAGAAEAGRQQGNVITCVHIPSGLAMGLNRSHSSYLRLTLCKRFIVMLFTRIYVYMRVPQPFQERKEGHYQEGSMCWMRKLGAAIASYAPDNQRYSEVGLLTTSFSRSLLSGLEKAPSQQ